MPIDLEDFCEDIIGKAMRGRSVTIAHLSAKSGVAPNWIERLLEGDFDEIAARAIAPHLKLDPDALAACGHKAWRPEPLELDGLAQFNTRWHDMRVNAYLVWDPTTKQAAAFDTGADASGMIEFAEAGGLQVNAIYLTHTHGDHIADLNRLSSAFGNPPIYVSEREPVDGAALIDESHAAVIGNLALETRRTWGHSEGGQTYVITGLARQVAIVGDALFAGSMGGGKVSFQDALETNRQQIFTLPDDTVVCPGHGPMSSVGEERQHNPFFAGG
jgi:hydroxyacylglutathione hydrolase